MIPTEKTGLVQYFKVEREIAVHQMVPLPASGAFTASDYSLAGEKVGRICQPIYFGGYFRG
jgi:hypothetical protein